ncbi:hypothetical protein [Nannocystis pusilla]|uniref:hypothetical protein n=1 Tax=Nannocystis pusilla TaxID=889268 RepID=UPI003BF185C2
MSIAIHSVKVAALKGAEIKLTVRSLEKGVTVSFCPILALRLLSALGAGAPVDRADFVDAHASPGELHEFVAECLESARSSVPRASVTFTLEVRDAAWLKDIKKGDGTDTAAYAAPARRLGAAFTADGAQVVVGWDGGAVEAHEVTQKRGRTALGKPVWAAQHLGLLSFTLLAEDVLVTAGRTELRAHRDGEPVAEVSLETGARVTALAADGTRALIGFADGSVAAWQPGGALVRLGGLDGPLVGLAAIARDTVAAATAGAAAVLRGGAIARTVPSTDGPITALARGTSSGAFVFGTAAGAVVWADASGEVTRKQQLQVQQDSHLGLLHRDGRGNLLSLARRGKQLFVATLEPTGLRFAGPAAEADDFSSAPATDGLVARVNDNQVMYLGQDAAVRFAQELPKGAVRAAHMSPPSYEPRVTRDGSALILGLSDQRAAELRSTTGAVLARADNWSGYFAGALALGQDAALVWFRGDAFRFTAAGSEQLPLKLLDAAPIERTGGAFVLVRTEDDTGRLIELDAAGREVAEIATIGADDVGSTSGLFVSEDGSLFKASVYDSTRGEHVPRCWLREGATFRASPAPWSGHDWPCISPDGRRAAWQSREDESWVLLDTHAGRELARIPLKDAWLGEFDGAGRLVLKSQGRLHWFDADGQPLAEVALPGKERVTPPVTRLLAIGGKLGVIALTPLGAFALGAKGDPAPLAHPAALAATDSLVAVGRGWPLEVADLH